MNETIQKKILKYSIRMLVLMCLCGIFVITLMISKNTDYNVHQNEKVNYEIVEYYKNNNLPLKNSNDIQMDLYYIIVGKYSKILDLFSKNVIFNARSFNLILLAILLIMCYKLYKKGNYLFLPLLISSQLWYMFAFINGNAWGIFINFMILYQLFNKDSMYQKNKNNFIEIILLGILSFFALSLNGIYLINSFLIFATYVIVNRKTVFCKDSEIIKKIVVIIGIGIVLLVGKYILSIWNNNQIDISESNSSVINIENGKEIYKKIIGRYVIYGKDILLENKVYKLVGQLYVILILYLILRSNKEVIENSSKERINKIAIRIIPLVSIVLSIIFRIIGSNIEVMEACIPILGLIMLDKRRDKIIVGTIIWITITLMSAYYFTGYFGLLNQIGIY